MAATVLDFTNVKESSGFNPKQQPTGDYHGKIVSFTDGRAKSSGNQVWTFGIQDVNMVSAVYPFRCTLNEEALWKLRQLIVATGKAVPQKRIKFDPETLVGKELGMLLVDDEYEGKVKSVIDTVFPASDLPGTEDAEDEDDDEDDEDDKPVAKKATKKAPAKKTKKPAKDEDEEDDETEDMDELDIDEL